MDGGIDFAYLDFFGLQIQSAVQDAITWRPNGMLPVGSCEIVRTGHDIMFSKNGEASGLLWARRIRISRLPVLEADCRLAILDQADISGRADPDPVSGKPQAEDG